MDEEGRGSALVAGRSVLARKGRGRYGLWTLGARNLLARPNLQIAAAAQKRNRPCETNSHSRNSIVRRERWRILRVLVKKIVCRVRRDNQDVPLFA